MKPARGYVTNDGTFFEREDEAALYEAEAALREKFSGFTSEIDKLLSIVIESLPELGRYINAYNATDTAKRDQQAKDEDRAAADNSPAPEANASVGHLSSAEEDLASLLKLPTRGPSNVSDVGSRPRPKEVSKRRSKHGA